MSIHIILLLLPIFLFESSLRSKHISFCAECNWDQHVTSVTHLGTFQHSPLLAYQKTYVFFVNNLEASCGRPDLSTSNEHSLIKEPRSKVSNHMFAHPLIHASKAKAKAKVQISACFCLSGKDCLVDSCTQLCLHQYFIG